MSSGQGYVSELRPPTGLLLILQTIYEYRELRWNNIDREKLLSSSEPFWGRWGSESQKP